MFLASSHTKTMLLPDTESVSPSDPLLSQTEAASYITKCFLLELDCSQGAKANIS